MKTKYEHIHFDFAPENFRKAPGGDVRKLKTLIYWCVSNRGNDYLGTVKWFGRWRQYCFFPAEEAVFSVGCMNDIIDFIKQLESLRNEAKKE